MKTPSWAGRLSKNIFIFSTMLPQDTILTPYALSLFSVRAGNDSCNLVSHLMTQRQLRQRENRSKLDSDDKK